MIALVFSAGCWLCLVCVFRTVDWFRFVCSVSCRESLFLTGVMSQWLGRVRPRQAWAAVFFNFILKISE